MSVSAPIRNQGKLQCGKEHKSEKITLQKEEST